MKNIKRKFVKVKSQIQLRADEIKTLQEQRAALVAEMNGIIANAETEVRALSDVESTRFTEIESNIKSIDSTIEMKTRAKDLQIKQAERIEKKVDEINTNEERAFEDYLRGVVNQERAATDSNLTFGTNGAIIPTTIMDRIIKMVVDICPIYQLAERINIGGNVSLPFYDETSGSIQMAYADEFKSLISTSGKYASIELKGYLAGALSKVSKQLINNAKFDVVGDTIKNMAQAISKFIEHECLIGTTNKASGMTGIKNIVTSASATAIVTDELIDVQEAIEDKYQMNAIWIMNKATRTYVRKFKDADGNYILNRDLSSKWGYTLLGKDVYCSAEMPKIAAGVDAIIYGDMSGLAVKVSEEASIEVLREKYSDEHAVGVMSWIEIDTKVQNVQKLSKLKLKAV